MLDVADRLNEKLLKKGRAAKRADCRYGAGGTGSAGGRRAGGLPAEAGGQIRRAWKGRDIGTAENTRTRSRRWKRNGTKAAGSPKECGAGRLEAQLDTLQKFQEEYENALSDIQNAQESMSDKLRDYGDLFTTVKGEAGGSFIELGDLQAGY